jgi:chemotaxis signal transduction protein
LIGPGEEGDSPEIRTLLELRAERLRRVPSSADDGALLWVAVFPLGGDDYALPLDVLVAAVPLRLVTPVPLAPSQLLGILRFRGEILPAFSLASLIGSRGWRQDPSILLIVQTRSRDAAGGPYRYVGVDCEQIPKATALPLQLVEQSRGRSDPDSPFLDVTTPSLQVVHLVDLDRLLGQGFEGMSPSRPGRGNETVGDETW